MSTATPYLPPAPPLQVAQWFNTREPITLEGLRGRVVVLHAFQMLCPGCVEKGIPQALRIDEAFPQDQLVVIGLHTVFEHHAVQGTAEALAAFIHEYRLRFPIGLDQPHATRDIPLTMQALMLQGTPGVEGLVRNDLTRGIMTEVDRVALAGTGSNTPTGVLYTTGIGSVTIGTNGGAPTWAHVNQLWREIAIDNADMGSLSYVTNAQVAYKLRTTSRQSSGVEGNFIMSPEGNTLAGFPVAITQQIPANLTKGSASGTLSAMLFGNWTDLLIGMWSGIDLLVDPYTGSSAGTVRVVAFQDLDVAVRHPESFAECNEILPT